MPNEASLIDKARKLNALANNDDRSQNGMICGALTELVIEVRGRTTPPQNDHPSPRKIAIELDSGNYEHAAFLSLTGFAGYMVSRGLSGDVFATVVIGAEGAEYSAVGCDVIRALAKAVASACVERYGIEMN